MKIKDYIYVLNITAIHFLASPNRLKRFFLWLKYGSREVFLEDIYRSCKRHKLAFDVGAYNGDSSLYIKHFVADKVYAFEPLKSMNRLANDDTFVLIRKPVYDGSFVDISGTDLTATTSKGNQLKSVRLSNYISEDCFVKLDCEGAEYIIFKDLFDTGKIKFIEEFVCEFHVSDNNCKFGDIISILEKDYILHFRSEICPLARKYAKQDILVHGFRKK